MNKRTFLKNSALLGIGSVAGLSSFRRANDTYPELPTEGGAYDDQKFWMRVRKMYNIKPDYINLENGYYCIQPQEILEKYLAHIQYVNREGAHYMRTVQFDNKKAAAEKLAELAGVNAEELVITRNTTESLDMIIGGLDWKAGDEAVMAAQDYGAMLDMFKQVATRYGVVNHIISLPQHPKNDEEIVDLYAAAITPRTRLLMVCQMVNITGQILPVRK